MHIAPTPRLRVARHLLAIPDCAAAASDTTAAGSRHTSTSSKRTTSCESPVRGSAWLSAKNMQSSTSALVPHDDEPPSGLFVRLVEAFGVFYGRLQVTVM